MVPESGRIAEGGQLAGHRALRQLLSLLVLAGLAALATCLALLAGIPGSGLALTGLCGVCLYLAWRARRQTIALLAEADRANARLAAAHDALAARIAEGTAALQAALDRYQVVSELTTDYAYSLSFLPDGTQVTDWYTEAFERVIGYGSEEIDRRGGFSTIVHPDDLPVARRRRERVLAGHDDTSVFRIIRPDGGVRWLRAHTRPIPDPATGRVIQIVGAMEDITERMEVEERFTRLFELFPDPIILHSDGRIILANHATARLFGAASVADLLEHPFAELIAPADRGRIVEQMARIARSDGVAQPAELRLVRLDGTIIVAEAVSGPVLYQERQAVQSVLRDITARRRAEEERRAIDQKMREAQRLESLGILAGGIAHDFNNLLTGILGNASLLSLDLPADEPHQATLAQIELAARRAADLTRQMLAYAGRASMTVQYIDLNDLVGEMVQLLRSSISRRAELTVSLDRSIPPIEADPTQIRQVVMNLIVNASDALRGDEGRITLTTGVAYLNQERLATTYLGDGLEPGDYVVLAVADTGCGMDEATVARIFDPFFTTKATGRGLGLAAVLGIIRSHRGTLHVRSRPGRGTIFSLMFPAAARGLVAPAAPAPVALGARQARFLVVDDEPEVRDLAARMLRRLGMEVSTAGDGQSALAALGGDPEGFDCILLDLTMPGMSGAETLAHVRALRGDIPVVLMSGYDEGETLGGLQGLRPSAFLPKPFTLADLSERIGEVLRVRAPNSGK